MGSMPPIDQSLWNILAGVCGAVIPMAFRTGMTPYQVVATGFTGTVVSVFGTPALVDRLDVTNSHYAAFFALMIGLLGMRACEIALKLFNKHGEQISKAVIKMAEIVNGHGGKHK